jgi:hypothetical protein
VLVCVVSVSREGREERGHGDPPQGPAHMHACRGVLTPVLPRTTRTPSLCARPAQIGEHSKNIVRRVESAVAGFTSSASGMAARTCALARLPPRLAPHEQPACAAGMLRLPNLPHPQLLACWGVAGQMACCLQM